MEFIINWLASLFETFKFKNPVVAAVVLIILSAAIVTVQKGELFGLFTLPTWANQVVTYVGLFITAVTGSQSFRYLSAEKQKTARK